VQEAWKCGSPQNNLFSGVIDFDAALCDRNWLARAPESFRVVQVLLVLF
jgi:hypothetical protein